MIVSVPAGIETVPLLGNVIACANIHGSILYCKLAGVPVLRGARGRVVG
jgi:hypothetical protein